MFDFDRDAALTFFREWADGVIPCRYHGPGLPANCLGGPVTVCPPALAYFLDHHAWLFEDMDAAYRYLCFIYEMDDTVHLRYLLGLPPYDNANVLSHIEKTEAEAWISRFLERAERKTDPDTVEGMIMGAYQHSPTFLAEALSGLGGIGAGDEEGEEQAYQLAWAEESLTREIIRDEDKGGFPVEFPVNVTGWISYRKEDQIRRLYAWNYNDLDRLEVAARTTKRYRIWADTLYQWGDNIAERWDAEAYGEAEQRRRVLALAVDFLDRYALLLREMPKWAVRAMWWQNPFLSEAIQRYTVELANGRDPLEDLLDLMAEVPFWLGTDAPLPPVQREITEFVNRYYADQRALNQWEREHPAFLIETEPACRTWVYQRAFNHQAAYGRSVEVCHAHGKYAYACALGFEGTFMDFMLLPKPKGVNRSNFDDWLKSAQGNGLLAHIGKAFYASSGLARDEFLFWEASMRPQGRENQWWREVGFNSQWLWKQDPQEWADSYEGWFQFHRPLQAK